MSDDGLLDRLVVSPLVLAHELPDLLVLVVVNFVLYVLGLQAQEVSEGEKGVYLLYRGFISRP